MLATNIPAPTADWTSRGAAELLRALDRAEVTSARLLDAFLARVDALDPKLAALVHLDRESALRQAEAADAARARGEALGPLHGLPMTVKDVFDTEDMPTTNGLAFLRDNHPTEDAPLVARIRAAGAIIFGKTSLPLGSYDWQCVHPIRGRCVNPWDPSRTPGGSSGGSAAALAARMTPLELGSDTAGSLRVPSHFSGVVSLRPTEGMLPLRGHGRVPGTIEHAFHQMTGGPMARSVEDVQRLFEVLVGPDPLEPRTAPLMTRAEPVDLSALRLGFCGGLPELMPDRSVRVALASARATLERAGATVVDRPLPLDAAETTRLWGRIQGFEFRHAGPWYLRAWPAGPVLGGLAFRGRLGAGPMTAGLGQGCRRSAAGYFEDLEARAVCSAKMDRFLEDVDAWIFPGGAVPAFTHRRTGRPIEVDGAPRGYNEVMALYQCPLTVVGAPIVTLPVGLSDERLPVGVQLVGRRYRDARLLEVARALEGALGRLPPAPV